VAKRDRVIVMKKTLLSALTVFLFLIVVSGAAIAGVHGSKIAQETARGDYAIAVAAGEVGHPTAIYLRVKSRPHQKVSGAWTVVCSKGYGAGSKSGDFSGTTTLVRKLRMPYKHPSSCTASASAQLQDGGFIKVQLYAVN